MWAIIVALASPHFATAQEAIPKPYAMERYQPVWENSPFEIETPPPPPKPKVEPQFAKNLTVAGVLEIGKITNVTIRDRSNNQYFELGPKKGYQGIQLVEVVQNEDLTQVEVTISKGKAKATIGYDAKMAKGPAQGPSVGGGGKGGDLPTTPALRGISPKITQQGSVPDSSPGAKNINPEGMEPTIPKNGGAGKDGSGTAGSSDNQGGQKGPKAPSQTPPRKPPTPKERLKIVIPGPLT